MDLGDLDSHFLGSLLREEHPGLHQVSNVQVRVDSNSLRHQLVSPPNFLLFGALRGVDRPNGFPRHTCQSQRVTRIDLERALTKTVIRIGVTVFLRKALPG